MTLKDLNSLAEVYLRYPTDESVYGELLITSQKFAFNILNKWGMQGHDAEDLASEISLTLQGGVLGRWNCKQSKYTTFFYGIVRNKFREACEKNKRRAHISYTDEL